MRLETERLFLRRFRTEDWPDLYRYLSDEAVRRIVARCDPENTASWRLLERLGMRREGCLRRNIWFKTDREGRPLWLDTYEYALLQEEYGGMDMGKDRTEIAEQRR